jgi:hypothetical protein
MRAKLLFLWWRTSHIRNNLIFGDGKCGIAHSSAFLQSYLSSSQDKRAPEEFVDPKGKKPMFMASCSIREKKEDTTGRWSKPAANWCKLNFDAGFSKEHNLGSWGAVLRDENGKPLLTAWGRIDHCQNAEMAEAIVGVQSIKAILPICVKPVHIENDYAEVIGALKTEAFDKSAISVLIREMRELLNLVPDFVISKVDRANNSVAHELAKLGRSEDGIVIRDAAPACVAGLIMRDCNPNSVF